MSPSIVFLAVSPAAASRSTRVARALASETHRAGLRPVFWSLSDLDPSDVLFGRSGAPSVARIVDAVKEAVGIVLATPVYKATYAGALKAVVDLIPPEALVDKPALGIATARQPSHAVGVDQAYRSLFAFFKARYQDTLFFSDDELPVGPEGGALSAEAEQRIRKSASALIQALPDMGLAVSRT
jgi:FMN reductase